MKIGIDASRAFLKKRTGIEEYSYQTIKVLRKHLVDHEVFLYIRNWKSKQIDFELPANWKIKEIPYVYGWTQVGLALEILLRPVDLFFSPAHTTAVIHPKKTIVTIHGLEYEHCPESYSTYSRWFHRFFIKRSCKWATKIIAVSKNTKKDLVGMYKINKDKISVVYNGFDTTSCQEAREEQKGEPFLFYVGRIEKRKNVEGIIKAFEILKKEKKFDGKLVLAGGPGHGYEEIKELIISSSFKNDIVELGYISEEKKWKLLSEAKVFMFPSFCEGFGIPILEAQSVGTPVLTSKLGPLDEVSGNEHILVDPKSPYSIAKKVTYLLDTETRKVVIAKGYENVGRFSWEKSGSETARIINHIAEDSSQDRLSVL